VARRQRGGVRERNDGAGRGVKKKKTFFVRTNV
jgi:hypothetical protein